MTTYLGNGWVEFRFYRPEVSQVCVAGSFNRWNVQSTPMQAEDAGWWSLSLRLESGEHQFRYIADGKWYTDHAANGIERSRGVWNSLLVVPSPAIRIAA